MDICLKPPGYGLLRFFASLRMTSLAAVILCPVFAILHLVFVILSEAKNLGKL